MPMRSEVQGVCQAAAIEPPSLPLPWTTNVNLGDITVPLSPHRGLRALFLMLLCCLLGHWGLARADDAARVKVADPYIEMHTGPGRGYPIFHVVERGAWVDVLRRRTDWFEVRTANGKEGWVYIDQMEQTLQPSGAPTRFERADQAQFANRSWEMGAQWGDLAGANAISLYGGYAFNRNVSTELTVTQALGQFSSDWLLDLSLQQQPFPEWRISPFFELGVGMIRTQPSSTLVQTEDRTDSTAHVGIGARVYLTRRFFFRAEYRSYVVFTSRNDNEEIGEWKAGFAFFF